MLIYAGILKLKRKREPLMKDNEKKYRRSAMSVICYVIALLMLFYIVYLAGSTVAQINAYYAQYDMSAKPMEYVTYIMQTILEPLINAVIFFMLGYILDEVRKNNKAYYLSDEDIEQAKIARQEAKAARQEEKAAKKAAAEDAAAVKADFAAGEMSVEEDFVKSLDEELNKADVKQAPRKRPNNSNGQKKTGENKPNQKSQNGQGNQSSRSNQGSQGKKNPDGAKTGNGSGNRRKSNKKPAADKPDAEAKEGQKTETKDPDSANKNSGKSGNRNSGNRRRSSRKPAADKQNAETNEAPKAEKPEPPKDDAIEALRAAAREADILE